MKTARRLGFPVCGFALVLLFAGEGLGAQNVTFERIVASAEEPWNWLTYGGSFSSQRYSLLDQITPDNVGDLRLEWVHQNRSPGLWEATPLVVDGIMYVTQRPNEVVAIDAATGRVFWSYEHEPSEETRACCGSNNRGLAIHGGTLFMGTLDAHLIAIDATTGKEVWNVEIADERLAYSITLAPLVVKDMVLIGPAGGEFGIRGFVAAYDVETGEERWRFKTIPEPGEPGHETWEGEDWMYGGGSVWVTGSYDPELDLTYWGIGNPGPDWNPDQRPGDNLYTDAVVALDAETGELVWHFQFTPNDAYDFDAVQVPVLVDGEWEGEPRRLMLWANRNGYFYVLDRTTGEFLLGEPFVRVNWASGLDENGRPIQTLQPAGEPTYPGNQGGTNWYPPAYSPRTGLFYFSVWEDYAGILRKEEDEYVPGRPFLGGSFRTVTPVRGAPGIGVGRSSPINTWTDAVGRGVTMAVDPSSGEVVWRFDQFDVTDSGMLTTASNLLFTGGREGYFYAFEAATGEVLWRASLGGTIIMAPITYAVDGKQYVTVISGNILATFGLRD
jgi:alcohol dehydrogenase (cytochrome c)